MNQQVNKNHYNFGKYSHPERWASYFYQLREVLALKPKNILEIGVGDKVFGEYIKNNTDVFYQSLDVAADLKPDIVGDILNIPITDKKFEAVCVFEVLEHLPFDCFEKVLQELCRVSSRNVVISLPHFGPPLKFMIKIPFLPEIKFAFKIPFYKKHEFNGEHYWELGKKNYETSKILKIINKNFKILKHFVPFENQYHHFFVLEKY